MLRLPFTSALQKSTFVAQFIETVVNWCVSTGTAPPLKL
jgi:hypothetical protein